jgi:hypothetical protein
VASCHQDETAPVPARTWPSHLSMSNRQRLRTLIGVDTGRLGGG